MTQETTRRSASGMYRDATKWLWSPVTGGGRLRWLLAIPIAVVTPVWWALVTVAAIVLLGVVLYSMLEDWGKPKPVEPTVSEPSVDEQHDGPDRPAPGG